MSRTFERVHFRLIRMPCCGHLFCNVNPRFPTFCPECGKPVIHRIKECVLISDDNASLKYDRGALQYPATPLPG